MFNLKFPNLNLDNSSARPFLFDRLYLHNFNFFETIRLILWIMRFICTINNFHINH